MCGQFTRKYKKKQIVEAFDVEIEIDPRIEELIDMIDEVLSPARYAPIAFQENDRLVLKPAYWWFMPSWSKTGKPDKWPMFNARSDKLLEPKSVFRPSFKSRRCIVPVTSFFEKKGERKDAIKFEFSMPKQPVFALAGVWNLWEPPVPKEGEAPSDRQAFDSFAIITTEPNELMAPIHHRMPVILDKKHFAEWLDPENDDIDYLHKLLVPYPGKGMIAVEQEKAIIDPKPAAPKKAKAKAKKETDQGDLF